MQYDEIKEACINCGYPLENRVSFQNNKTEPKIFTYMELGQKMHLECYIEHIIDTYLDSRDLIPKIRNF